MVDYKQGYKQKNWFRNYLDKSDNYSWPNSVFNKKGGEDTNTFQSDYRRKSESNFFKKVSNKKNNRKSYNGHNFNNDSSGAKQHKHTVVNIVDSDVEMCYGETNSREIINEHLKDDDLFFFDISGNRHSPKHIIHSSPKHISRKMNQSSSNLPEILSPSLTTNKSKKKKKKSSISSNSDIWIENSTKPDKITIKSEVDSISDHNNSNIFESIQNLNKNDFADSNKEISNVCDSKLSKDDLIDILCEENHTSTKRKRSKEDVNKNATKNKKRRLSEGISTESASNLEISETDSGISIKKKKKGLGYENSESVHKRKKKDKLSKDEFEETFHKLDVDADSVLNEYEQIYNGSKHKLTIEDVYGSDEEARHIDVLKKWDETIATTPQDIDEDEKVILSKLCITLPFDDIPPLHNISRPSKPTQEETERGKLLNAKMGPYSKEEDEQIKENWNNFCKDHDLTLPPSVFFRFHRCMKKKEKIKFMQYLAHKLDNRHPFNVHFRFQRLYIDKNIKSGRFTEEEDKEILKFLKETCSVTPYRDLGILLGRSAHAIRRRCFVLENGYHEKKVEWNLDLTKRLIEGMLTITGKERVEDLENVSLNSSQWRQLSDMLDNIPSRKLYSSWYVNIHPKLFLKENIEEVKRDLVKMMLINKERDYRTVNWKKYAENFSGVNEVKLYEIFANMVRYCVPEKKRSDLRRVVKCLSKQQNRSRKVRRYIYRNGDLEVEQF